MRYYWPHQSVWVNTPIFSSLGKIFHFGKIFPKEEKCIFPVQENFSQTGKLSIQLPLMLAQKKSGWFWWVQTDRMSSLNDLKTFYRGNKKCIISYYSYQLSFSNHEQKFFLFGKIFPKMESFSQHRKFFPNGKKFCSWF